MEHVILVDGSIDAYRTRLGSWTGLEGWTKALAQVEPSNKFSDGQAKHFPGLSIVSPPGPESRQWQNFYRPLLRLRDQLLQELSGLHHPVPDQSLHLTGADLIAGPNYDNIGPQRAEFDATLSERIEFLWASQVPVSAPLRWRVHGIAFFQHALVCLLDPVDERDYEPLIRFRNAIYADSKLAELGVQKTKPFMAHITLAYYQEIPNEEARQAWVGYAQNYQDAIRTLPTSFIIDHLDVRRFEDMTAYHALAPQRRFTFGAKA